MKIDNEYGMETVDGANGSRFEAIEDQIVVRYANGQPASHRTAAWQRTSKERTPRWSEAKEDTASEVLIAQGYEVVNDDEADRVTLTGEAETHVYADSSRDGRLDFLTAMGERTVQP